MTKKGFRGEFASRQDLEYFSRFGSYRDLLEYEFPSDERLEGIEMERRKAEYARRSTSLKIDRSSPRFKNLEGLVIMDHLKEMDDFEELMSMLEAPQINNEKIGSKIERLRKLFFDIEIFSRRRIKTVKSKDDYEREFEKIVEWRMEDVNEPDLMRPDSIEKPLYAVESFQVERLYHWIPEEFAESVMGQGLLPGFLSGISSKSFVYSALERNNFWTHQLGYPRFELKKVRKFLELEIEYDDSMEAFMWMAYFFKKDMDKFYSSCYPGTVLSSRLVSLDRQVSELVNSDRNRPIDKYTAEEEMYFSQLLQKKIPYCFNSGIGSWETSEVMLNYVPPDRIKIIGEAKVQ